MNQAEKIKLSRLYKIAQELQIKKPWDFFEDIGIFAVTLSNRKTPFYCVLLEETVIVCPNKSALKGLLYLSNQNDMPEIQRLRYQQHLALFYDTSEEIAPEVLETIEELGIQPIEGKYPYFESVMPGLMPDQLVKQEIQSMVDILKQLNDSMEEIDEILALKHDINKQIVHRYFDFDQKKWTFNLLHMIDQDLDVHPIHVKEDFISQCNEQNIVDEKWEVDVAYTPVMMEQRQGHRQAVIRVLVIANHTKNEVYHQKLVTLKDDSNKMLVDKVINNILDRGKPTKIVVRDDIVFFLLKNVSESLNIPIEVNQNLPMIDRFVEVFVNQTIS